MIGVMRLVVFLITFGQSRAENIAEASA
jgi:hypothetical protein